MYLLLWVVLLGSTFGVPLTEIATGYDNLKEHYELPGESIPTLYDVRLFLDPSQHQDTNFFGNVSINIIPVIETDTIALHAMKMSIDNVQVYNDNDADTNLFEDFTLAEDDTHLLTIRLNKLISPMESYIIHIDFVGQYDEDSINGIYIESYKTGNQTNHLIASQMQATYARRSFPCYDEPELKAVFRTTIYASPEYAVVLSNMPERSDELKENITGYLKHEFQDTPIMSTYLQAYLVCNYDYIDNTNDPIYRIPYKVFFPPGNQKKVEFALNFGQKNIVALEQYTEFPYALPKLDNAAVVNFAEGGMENMGLIFYSDSSLFVQDGVTTTHIKQLASVLLSHENAHQWFGNEVTTSSWRFLWLNEGFATFFEYYSTDMVLPEWRLMDQFVVKLQNVMQVDAVLSEHPMTHPVYSPSQIEGAFNDISYYKSGTVFRMLQNILTPEVFRRGLIIYLKNNSGGATSPEDLDAAFQQGLDESDLTIPYSVSEVMDRWTNQAGFPVLTVRRSTIDDDYVSVSQERFFTDSALSSTDLWHVPVNWVISSKVDFSDTSPQAWLPPSSSVVSIKIPGLSKVNWFIINKQETGYYRVNYDAENWQALARALHTSYKEIHVLNRAQIIDDSFNFAANGKLNYTYALEISKYLAQEIDFIPWSSANNAFETLDAHLRGSHVYNLYQKYLLNLTAPLYSKLGFEASPGEEHVTAFHRDIILNINCQNGNKNCVDQAHQLFQEYRNNPARSLNPDIEPIVFCSCLRGGSADNFYFLWNQFTTSTDDNLQDILLDALGCTSDPTLRDFILNQTINRKVIKHEHHIVAIINSVTRSSPENTDAALDFFIEHFTVINRRVRNLMNEILTQFFKRLNTQRHNARVEELCRLHEKKLTDEHLETIASIRENIEASTIWANNNLATVEAWLRLNYESSANALTSTIFSLLSTLKSVSNLIGSIQSNMIPSSAYDLVIIKDD